MNTFTDILQVYLDFKQLSSRFLNFENTYFTEVFQ